MKEGLLEKAIGYLSKTAEGLRKKTNRKTEVDIQNNNPYWPLYKNMNIAIKEYLGEDEEDDVVSDKVLYLPSGKRLGRRKEDGFFVFFYDRINPDDPNERVGVEVSRKSAIVYRADVDFKDTEVFELLRDLFLEEIEDAMASIPSRPDFSRIVLEK